MRASGLLEETRELLRRENIDIFPEQLLKEPVSRSALEKQSRYEPECTSGWPCRPFTLLSVSEAWYQFVELVGWERGTHNKSVYTDTGALSHEFLSLSIRRNPTDWREEIQRGAEAAGLDVVFTAPVTDHPASDAAGDHPEVRPANSGAITSPPRSMQIRTRTLIEQSDMVNWCVLATSINSGMPPSMLATAHWASPM